MVRGVSAAPGAAATRLTPSCESRSTKQRRRLSATRKYHEHYLPCPNCGSTVFSGRSIPSVMVALVLGALGLLLDWFRDARRFSTSVLGMAVATAAIVSAFIPQGRKSSCPVLIGRGVP